MKILEVLDINHVENYGGRGMTCFALDSGSFVYMTKEELKLFIEHLTKIHDEMK